MTTEKDEKIEPLASPFVDCPNVVHTYALFDSIKERLRLAGFGRLFDNIEYVYVNGEIGVRLPRAGDVIHDGYLWRKAKHNKAK